jgi:hypothetical protein
MTAYRIVTDHEELEGSGQLAHEVLDDYVLHTPWIILSGATGPQPPSGRRLKAGPGVTFTDQGPGLDLIISANGVTTGSQVAWMESPTGDRNNGNLNFGLAYAPLPSGSLMFFYNGQLLEQGPVSDYVVSGSTVSLLFLPRSGSNFWATYPF